MRLSNLLIGTLFFLLVSPPSATAQTCAKRRLSDFQYHEGQPQVVIDTTGLPNRVQSALKQAAARWNNKCPQAGVPDFSATAVDPALPYDPTTQISVQVIDDSPLWDPTVQGWKAARYTADTAGGISEITVFLRCPPNQNGKTFVPCTNGLIDWASSHGAALMAHEYGHGLGLTHDSCSMDSVMQAQTAATAQVLAAHCQLVDVLNCNPANPPPGGCPVAGDLADFEASVSGLSTGDTLWIEHNVSLTYDPDPAVSADWKGGAAASTMQDGVVRLGQLVVGQHFTITSLFINNTSVGRPGTAKTCTASPDSGAASSAGVSLSVTCACPDGSTDSSRCIMDLPQDLTKLEPFLPLWPIFADPWPWYLTNFGPIFPDDPEPCERQTECTETTVEFDGETVEEVLTCHDSCVPAATVGVLYGPSTQLTLSGGDHAADGTLLVDGYAVDANGVYDLAFYVDHQRVTLSGFQRNLYRPEACSQAPAPNRLNCTSYGGFAGTLDAASFGPGTHMLQVVALDARPGYPAATLVERPFTVPSCLDTTKPSVSLIDPREGEAVRGTVEMWASATDDVGVSRVDFFVDGTQVATDTSAPYTFSWNSLTVPDGAHTVNVRAWDACGNRRWDSAPTHVTVTNSACSANATTLCFQSERFSARVTINGSAGVALPLSDNGGFFWLSEAENVEVAVKVLDGRSVNGRFWVFHGSLTTMPYTLTVTDHSTGVSRTFEKPASSLCGSADTSTFLDTSGLAFDQLTSSPCTPTSTGLCLLGDRFLVRVIYNTSLPGLEVTPKTGSFGIESVLSPEVVVKVLDGRAINNRFWVFFGSLTDRFYQVQVTDTVTGISKTYNSPVSFCGTADVAAF